MLRIFRAKICPEATGAPDWLFLLSGGATFGKNAQKYKSFTENCAKIVDTRAINCYSESVSLYIYLCLVFR